MKNERIIIIGAGEFQQPLILKANALGFETHVFAWSEGAIARNDADYFYDISIVDIDEITKISRTLGASGVITSGSDLAAVTVSEVARHLGLPCNSSYSTKLTMNKYNMREAWQAHQIPSPWFKRIHESEVFDLDLKKLSYPLIIKPTDRSGSRAVTKINKHNDLEIRQALHNSFSVSFERSAIIEEYIQGIEYSCESISYNGEHYPLVITQKYTSGHPHFIETGHLQPASITQELKKSVFSLAKQSLDALGVELGASHFEFKVTPDNLIIPIELGARSGGDYISTDLVELSTGYDYLKMIIQCGLGQYPEFKKKKAYKYSAVQFFVNSRQKELYQRIWTDHPEWIIRSSVEKINSTDKVLDSSMRHGFVIYASDDVSMLDYL